MEDVLDLYEEPYDPDRSVVCFDETSKQLTADKSPDIPAKPGQAQRYDYEYKRNGTRNLFMFCEPLRGWRHLEVNRTSNCPGLRPPDEVAGRRGISRGPGSSVGAG